MGVAHTAASCEAYAAAPAAVLHVSEVKSMHSRPALRGGFTTQNAHLLALLNVGHDLVELVRVHLGSLVHGTERVTHRPVITNVTYHTCQQETHHTLN